MSDPSQKSLEDANRDRVDYSGHGNAIGAAGHHEEADAELNKDSGMVNTRGDSITVSPPDEGFHEDITIGLSWDNLIVEQAQGFMDKMLRRTKKVLNQGVDLDIGCLYELKNGDRGCLQPFGDLYGAHDKEPYIHISGDERTGNTEGADEMITINAQKWNNIKRILVYIYIYDGTPNWETIKPEILIDIPGDEDLKMTPHATKSDLTLCSIAMLENVKGGIRLTNHSKYFPGHAEMDRAFGFGLQWEDGAKE